MQKCLPIDRMTHILIILRNFGGQLVQQGGLLGRVAQPFAFFAKAGAFRACRAVSLSDKFQAVPSPAQSIEILSPPLGPHPWRSGPSCSGDFFCTE
jgi:hypothetical protein